MRKEMFYRCPSCEFTTIEDSDVVMYECSGGFETEDEFNHHNMENHEDDGQAES